MKVNSTIYPVFKVLFAVLLLSILFSCKKEVIPSITVAVVTNIAATSATSGGEITSDGGAGVIARGVCWSTSHNPTTADSKTTNGTGTGSFTSSITGLTPGATYNLKAYAINAVGTAYSSPTSFSTLALAPVLTTTDVSAITQSSVNSGGNITNDGGSPVTARGVCWSTSQNPTIVDSKSADGTGIGIFTSSITGLTLGTTYYVRAYATNSIGTSYGNQVSFTTLSPPTVTTAIITGITQTTATSGGNVTVAGGTSITARGVCWSTTQNPTTSDSKTSDATGTGTFISTLTGLTGNTTYYVRAYATNSVGTAYGNQVSFITSPIMPSLSTTTISSITQTTATSGGNVTSDGGATVTDRGVCWSTSTTPTITNSKTTDGTGTGSFTSSLTNLSANTTYYMRAYATNTAGTGYGNQLTFTTSQIALATLTTTAITSITQTTATSGGNVSTAGGTTVTARGVCWSTTLDPTISDSKTSDASGTGTFISTLTGLIGNTTYYVRAYATNSVGTAYGNQVSFKTSPIMPAITTIAISSITATSCNSGGNISSDGGASVTARGVCWSTSANPTTALSTKTTDGTGTGSFASSITGLTAGRLYYVKAYATNSAGTAYGSQITFITQIISGGTVPDVDGNTYSTVTIGTQEWMGENLMTTKYNDGTAIPNVTSSTTWTGLTTGAYCWYNNAATSYGALYNWYTVNTGKLCPTGWHVPNDAEWTILTTYLGGENVAGGKLKETGTSNWISPNTGATNSSGFTALPGGNRSSDGTFYGIGVSGDWWSSSEYNTASAWSWYMYYSYSDVTSYNYGKRGGFSVRCLRD